MSKKLVSVFVLFAGLLVLTGCTTTVNNNTPSQTYSMSEVQKHGSKSDCWMVIEGNVYNVTTFIAFHPGGDVIAQGCGKDATQLFNTQGGQGSHSGSARAQLKDFLIGKLQ